MTNAVAARTATFRNVTGSFLGVSCCNCSSALRVPSLSPLCLPPAFRVLEDDEEAPLPFVEEAAVVGSLKAASPSSSSEYELIALFDLVNLLRTLFVLLLLPAALILQLETLLIVVLCYQQAPKYLFVGGGEVIGKVSKGYVDI
jgi:hypothetical protein